MPEVAWLGFYMAGQWTYIGLSILHTWLSNSVRFDMGEQTASVSGRQMSLNSNRLVNELTRSAGYSET
jgi:hypothetical protein